MKLDNAELKAALAGTNVRAIFAGHLHARLGADTDSLVVDGRTVQVFRSGSSVYQQFLLVEFLSDRMRVAGMSSADGKPKIIGSVTEVVWP